VLLDEPLESLDRGLRDRVLGWIEGRLGQGATVVVVSHQLEPFAALATTAVTVRGGRAVGPIHLAAPGKGRLAVLEHLARGEPLDPTAH